MIGIDGYRLIIVISDAGQRPLRRRLLSGAGRCGSGDWIRDQIGKGKQSCRFFQRM
jgi:hypothetical protein